MDNLSASSIEILKSVNAFILNGLSIGHMKVYGMVANEFEKTGWQVTGFDLHKKKIAACMGCFGCWVKTPGVCVIDDDGREVARLAVESDLVVCLTSVTFGGYSSHLKKALDRMIPVISPFFMKKEGEIHHKPRYARYPHLLVVGVLSIPDEESEKIFKTLVARNALNHHGPTVNSGVVVQSDPPERIRELIAGFSPNWK